MVKPSSVKPNSGMTADSKAIPELDNAMQHAIIFPPEYPNMDVFSLDYCIDFHWVVGSVCHGLTHTCNSSLHHNAHPPVRA